MICLIDNYDSFSYNLYQLLGSIEPDVRVIRNDGLTVGELQALSPDAVVLSPGPGRPADAGICEDVVRSLTGRVPILGVCLGHQAIVEAFGGVVTYASAIMHGKASRVTLDPGCELFRGIESPTTVARYHSLAADAASMPQCLRVTATTDDGEVMAVRHVDAPTFGVQFHPESVMTPEGSAMARNFLDVVDRWRSGDL